MRMAARREKNVLLMSSTVHRVKKSDLNPIFVPFYSLLNTPSFYYYFFLCSRKCCIKTTAQYIFN